MKLWYAIQQDVNDNDQGTGSFNLEEAKEMCKIYNCTRIAVIEAHYDDNWTPTSDTLCIDIIIV